MSINGCSPRWQYLISGGASLLQSLERWLELVGRWMAQHTEQSWKKTCWSLQKTWGRGSSSRKTSSATVWRCKITRSCVRVVQSESLSNSKKKNGWTDLKDVPWHPSNQTPHKPFAEKKLQTCQSVGVQMLVNWQVVSKALGWFTDNTDYLKKMIGLKTLPAYAKLEAGCQADL